MGNDSDNYLMLSGIQHYFFCKRQWALIHIEQYWKDNALTAQGREVHDKVDQPQIKEKRKNIFYSRAMPVVSNKLHFVGKLDLVEFRQEDRGIELKDKDGKWFPYIVEYKRGKPKKSNIDIVQLTAEVMALEETLEIKIESAYFYYNEVRRRQEVFITEDLRKIVINAAKDMYEHFKTGKIFKAENYKNCSKCSLEDYCMPRLTKKKKNVKNYLRRQYYEKT